MMDEDIDACIEADSGAAGSLDVEPLSDTSFEEAVLDSTNENESPISEQELTELQNEAETLDIQPYEPSALLNIINAGAEGAASTADTAQDVYTQGLRAGLNMGIEGSREFMDAAIRQHGKSPAAVLQEMQIQQAIDSASNPLEQNDG
jgi:hypothetical protein